jgi:hypothetical protein
MELRKPLQTCHLVDQKPDALLVFVAGTEQMQDEHIEPDAMQRANGFACVGR